MCCRGCYIHYTAFNSDQSDHSEWKLLSHLFLTVRPMYKIIITFAWQGACVKRDTVRQADSTHSLCCGRSGSFWWRPGWPCRWSWAHETLSPRSTLASCCEARSDFPSFYSGVLSTSRHIPVKELAKPKTLITNKVFHTWCWCRCCDQQGLGVRQQQQQQQQNINKAAGTMDIICWCSEQQGILGCQMGNLMVWHMNQQCSQGASCHLRGYSLSFRVYSVRMFTCSHFMYQHMCWCWSVVLLNAVTLQAWLKVTQINNTSETWQTNNKTTITLHFLAGVALARCPCSSLEWWPSSSWALSFLRHLFPVARNK